MGVIKSSSYQITDPQRYVTYYVKAPNQHGVLITGGYGEIQGNNSPYPPSYDGSQGRNSEAVIFSSPSLKKKSFISEKLEDIKKKISAGAKSMVSDTLEQIKRLVKIDKTTPNDLPPQQPLDHYISQPVGSSIGQYLPFIGKLPSTTIKSDPERQRLVHDNDRFNRKKRVQTIQPARPTKPTTNFSPKLNINNIVLIGLAVYILAGSLSSTI